MSEKQTEGNKQVPEKNKITEQFVNQNLFIKKIISYLKGRNRDNMLAEDEKYSIAGLCNGAALLLLKIVYDAQEKYLLSDRAKPLIEWTNEAVNAYIAKIATIINWPDEDLDSNDHQTKLNIQTTEKYIHAKQKLQNAIDSGHLNIPEKLKQQQRNEFKKQYQPSDTPENIKNKTSFNYQLQIIKLAKEQRILSNEEAELLIKNHIADIPAFECFINEIFLLQNSGIFNNDLEQTNFSEMISLLTETSNNSAKKAANLPINTFSGSYIFTPEEFIDHFKYFMLENHLMKISLPKHAICAFYIAGKFFLYDSNNADKKMIVCESFEEFALKFMLSIVNQKILTEVNTISFEKQIASHEIEINSFFSQYKKIINFKILLQQLISKFRTNIIKQAPILLQENIKSVIKKIQQEPASNHKKIFHSTFTRIYMPEKMSFSINVFCHPQLKSNKAPEIDTSLLKQMLTRKDNGNTILHHACKNKNIAFLKAILTQLQNNFTKSSAEKKDFLNSRDDSGITPLIALCIAGFNAAIKLLIEAGADPSQSDHNGNTPLHYAAKSRNKITAKLLFKHGLNPNHPNHEGYTPFHLLCLKGNLHCLELFLKYKADINYCGPNNSIDPLNLILKKHSNYNLLEKLLTLGANPNKQIKYHTPLTKAIAMNDVKAIKLLLKYGADPNYNNPGQQSPIDMALLFRNKAVIKLLLKYGLQINRSRLLKKFQEYQLTEMEIYINNPVLLKNLTHAEKIGQLFKDYVSPKPNILFSGHWNRHHTKAATLIYTELLKPENKNINDNQIIEIIKKNIPKNLNPKGDFHKCLDCVETYLGKSVKVHSELSKEHCKVSNSQT